MNTIAVFAAILSVATAAHVAVYNSAVPTWTAGHSTEVKSDRLGGSFAYSVKENPALTYTTYAATAPVHWNSAWTAPATTWTATAPVSNTWNTHSVPVVATKSAWATPSHTWNTNWNTPSQTWNTNTPSHIWNTNWNTGVARSAWTGQTVPATSYTTTGTGSSVVAPGWNSWNTYASGWPSTVHGYQVVQ